MATQERRHYKMRVYVANWERADVVVQATNEEDAMSVAKEYIHQADSWTDTDDPHDGNSSESPFFEDVTLVDPDKLESSYQYIGEDED